MAKSPHPVIGMWYNTANNETLEVVAIDDHDQTIEVQYYDGTVEEFDLETWRNLEISESEPPQDMEGVFDELEYEPVKEHDYQEMEGLNIGEWTESLNDEFD